MSPPSTEQVSETTPLLAAETGARVAKFPRSRQEAMDDIEDIRRSQEHRLRDEEYQRMLRLLSDGQNTNVSRFLYELLQNADDARYGSKTPQVLIQYSTRQILFESNEIGFSKADLDSICRATMSTKRGNENSKERRSIGEKGIGFKSVFMVATSVWIKSGYYSFRFDGATPLGRVRPIWDEDWPGPLKRSRGFTSILLMLPDRTRPPEGMKIVDPKEVINAMKELDVMDLVFLSQVKNVRMQLVDDTSWAKKMLGNARWQTALNVGVIAENVKDLINLETRRDGIAESHVVFRYPITGLPPTSDRPNLTTSEVILLFDQNIDTSNDEPIVPSRKTYAFLPIRNYNLKFTIHSDFILVSNREDMEPVQWNREIVKNIPHAFAEAVGQFRGRYPDLWLSWPLLLPLGELGGDIFRGIQHDIKTVLYTRYVLEDVNGNSRRPQDLRIVPHDLRDKDGALFFPLRNSRQNVLSEKYSGKTKDKLIELGVPFLSHESFLEELSDFISNHSTEFGKKQDSWHDELCKLLLDLLGSSKHRKAIEAMNIIPISLLLPNGDRQWVSSKLGKLYFPVETRGLKLPPGIRGMYEIHQNVTKNFHQAKLCRELGAKDVRLHELCDYVILKHTDSFTSLFTWSLNDMVSHLVFLYESKWKPPDDSFPDLWYICKDGKYGRNHEIYQECEEQYSAQFISNLEHYGRELRFLHPLYVSAFRRFQDGSEWLDETMGLRKQLRLVTSLFGAYKLHNDFRSLLTDEPQQALKFLRYNWSFYRSWFVSETENQLPSMKKQDAPKTLDDKARDKLRSCVARAKFPCHSSPERLVTCTLQTTFLGREELLLLCEQAKFPRCERPVRSCWSCNFMSSLRRLRHRTVTHAIVDSERILGIDDPDRRDWDFLETFGVFVKPGGRLYIDHLSRIRGMEVSYDHMQNLYEQLERFAVGPARSNIKAALTEHQSIYIPIGAGSGRWSDSSSVVWDGPSSLKHVPRLICFYEARSYLFQTILEIPDADLTTLRTEVKHLMPENIHHVTSVLRSISEYLEPWNDSSQAITDVSKWPMFPVNPKGANPWQIELKTASDVWCIPVSMDHQKGFLGKANLSVIFAATFRDMVELCRHLRLDSKFMSSLLYESSARHRGSRIHKGYTERLRRKALYIASLIPSRYDRNTYATLLKSLIVYQSDQILVHWNLKAGGEVVQSHPMEDQVTVEIESSTGTLVIHMVDKNGLLNLGYSPIQLSHMMGDVCKIKESRDFGLLVQILAQDELKLIEADLDAHLEETGRTRLEQPSDSDSDAIFIPHNTILHPKRMPAFEEAAKRIEKSEAVSAHEQDNDALPVTIRERREGEIKSKDSASKRSMNSRYGQIENRVRESFLVDTQDSRTKTDDNPIIDEEAEPTKDVDTVPYERGSPSTEAGVLTKSQTPKNQEQTPGSAGIAGPKADIKAGHRDGAAIDLDDMRILQSESFEGGQINKEPNGKNVTVVHQSPTAKDCHPLEKPKVHDIGTDGADAPRAAPKEGDKFIGRDNRNKSLGSQQQEQPRLKSEDDDVGEQRDLSPARTSPASMNVGKTLEKDSPVPGTSTNEGLEEKAGHHLRKSDQAPTCEVTASGRSPNDNEEPGKLKVSSIAIGQTEPSENKQTIKLKSIENNSDTQAPLSDVDGNQRIQREANGQLQAIRQPSPYIKRAPSPSIYIPSSDREEDSRPRRLRTSTSHEFMNMNKGFVQYHQPTTVFAGRDTEETRYFGELYVSEYLHRLLPGTYNPSEHWTSRQYSKSFSPPTSDCSTFTIPDAGGKLMEAIVQEGQIDKNLLEAPCTVHVQVCVSNADLHSSFVLPNIQFEKARRMSIRKDQKSNQVYILALVYKVQDDPGIAMYVDPWKPYLDESISLQSESRYVGAISKSEAVRPMLHQESTRGNLTLKSHVIYRDLPIRLGEIRILKLNIDGDNEPLSGSLEVRSVSDAKYCWALSYVWGPNPTELRPIYFKVGDKQIMITESLSVALKQLRRKLRDSGANSAPPPIWADALCIDQSNNVEKSQQVSLMGSIYGGVKRVMVWTGNEKDEDAGVIELLAWLHEQLYGHQDQDNCRCRDEEEPSTDSLPSEDDACWPAIEAFLRREWFVRVWIIQELVLGSDAIVMCGEREIRWDCFAQTLRVCERYLNQGDHDRRYLPNSSLALSLDGVRKFYQGHRKFTFLQLLEMFYLSRSTWRRDRFFALLNLASDDNLDTGDFQPDYESSEENVLAKYARGFVRLGLAPSLLYRAGSGKACPSSSWIPDFMRRRRMDPQYPQTISTWEARSGPFRAGSRIFRKKPSVQFLTPGSGANSTSHLRPVLNIQSYEIDTVADCQSLNIVYSHTAMSFGTLNRVRNYLKFYLRGQNENLVIKLLIGDARRPQPFYAGRKSSHLEEWPPGFEEKLLRAIEPDQDGREYDMTHSEDRFLNLHFWATVRAFGGRIPDAAVCFTEKGHAGIVPGDARPGDKIVAIQGAAVPFIVGNRLNIGENSNKNSPRYLTLIGECYVDGLMYFHESSLDRQPQDIYLV